MKKTKITATVVCLCLLLSFTACAPSDNDPVNVVSIKPTATLETSPTKKNINVDDIISVAKVTARELQQPSSDKDPTTKAVSDGANDFAFRLSAALAKNAGTENFVLSPYSVWLPLAALLIATDEQSKAALLDAIGVAGISEQDVNDAASRMLYDLTKLQLKDVEGYYNPLKIINAIFVDKKVTLKKQFAQTFMDYYRGNSINVDFESQDAVDAVNQWASENTDGLIKDLVKEFGPDTLAAIANAIYFSDRWQWEFDEKLTTENVFHAPNGDTKAQYMMLEDMGQTYYEDDKIQAMPLQFLSGGGMYIILPKNGDATELLSSMTNEYFNRIQKESIPAIGKLLLPRFSIEGDIVDLKGSLMQLGVPLFDTLTMPVKELIDGPDLVVDKAIQKAVIEVNEKGTTAAAVTLLTLIPTSGKQYTKSFVMDCNKPFVFVLYDRTHDGVEQVLFTGIVNQP